MAEYIDIDYPLLFKDIRNREIRVTVRDLLKANHAECVLADVAPARHGRWSREKNYETGYEIWVNVCSACGAITPVNVSRYKYCPNCGAKMDKEKE